MADDDSYVIRYRDIDPNDSKAMKEMIAHELKGVFLGLDEDRQADAKISLAYYLTTNRIDWTRTYDAELLPMNPPDEARDFFVWIWQVLYADEDYHLDNLDGYTEENRPLH